MFIRMARDKAPSDGNDKTQRRVYVLPNDLVEKIIAYQNKLGLTSEVEAARRLLYEALLSKDTIVSIVASVVQQLKSVKSLRDAVKEVLASHPLVTRISYENGEINFAISDGHQATVSERGIATIKDDNDNLYDFLLEEGDVPDWASSSHKPASFGRTVSKTGGGRMSEVIDDDIPF